MKSMRYLCALLFAGAAMSAAAQAQAPATTDPRLLQLEAEVALLTAKAAIAEKKAAIAGARFGEPATAPAGTISGQENFAAFGQWALADVYGKIGDQARTLAVYGSKCPRGFLVTKTGDRSERLIAAGIVKKKIDEYTILLASIQPPAPPAAAPVPAAALPAAVMAISGLLGSADKLVGLFRSDYTISAAGADVDELAPVVAAATGLRAATGADVIVEGLDQRSSGGELVRSYQGFFKALQDAHRRYARALSAATTADDKAKLAGDGALLDAADAFDTALTVSDAGTVPLVGLALAFESTQRCTLVVHVAGLKTSLITRKRLLSRNDELIAVSGGTIALVLFNADGGLLDTQRLTIDRRIAGRLDKIVKTAMPIGSP